MVRIVISSGIQCKDANCSAPLWNIFCCGKHGHYHETVKTKHVFELNPLETAIPPFLLCPLHSQTFHSLHLNTAHATVCMYHATLLEFCIHSLDTQDTADRDWHMTICKC